MEDKKIIKMFFGRNESAIEAAKEKYGGLCMSIAYNLLSDVRDAEECVNDTYHAAWNSIPPQDPSSLKAFLGRLTRNIAISRYRKNTAEKRFDGITVMLSELADCLPAQNGTEQVYEGRQLTELIDSWLQGLEREDRVIFVRRYWFGYDLKTIAGQTSGTASQLAARMYRLRASLKEFLEKEGVSI